MCGRLLVQKKPPEGGFFDAAPPCGGRWGRSPYKLKMFRLAYLKHFDEEKDFPIKTHRFSIFNFRTLLNISMLLSNSEKARELRSLILDIVIDL